MNTRLRSLFAALFLAYSAGASSPAPVNPLPRATPESAGVLSENLLKYISELDSKVDGMHSVMLVVKGSVIAEGWWHPYEPQSRHTMYSLSKSFASTAIGIAQAEGKLSVDDTVVSFFPDLVPTNASPNLKSMRIRDLLAMSTGHHNEEINNFDYSAEDAVKRFLAIPVAHKPGTHFVYNTPASFMLSAIVQKVTGEPLTKYLAPRLFVPLGIQNPKWDAGKSGIEFGGFGLHITTEDIARFGLLYLREGNYNGRQLLTKDWVKAATARQTSNGSSPRSDWEQGYGYQFWRARHGAYRGDGAFGQYCIVIPQHDAVVAITSGVRDMQAVLDITWDKLLPALSISSGGQPDNPAAQKALVEKLGHLEIKPISGTADSVAAKKMQGKKLKFADNAEHFETISIQTDPKATTLAFHINGKSQSVTFSPGNWTKGEFAYGAGSRIDAEINQPAAATGAWSGNTLTARIAFIETPYTLTLKIDLGENEAILNVESNVGFGPTKRPELKATLEN